jgi:hypothetical protein
LYFAINIKIIVMPHNPRHIPPPPNTSIAYSTITTGLASYSIDQGLAISGYQQFGWSFIGLKVEDLNFGFILEPINGGNMMLEAIGYLALGLLFSISYNIVRPLSLKQEALIKENLNGQYDMYYHHGSPGPRGSVFWWGAIFALIVFLPNILINGDYGLQTSLGPFSLMVLYRMIEFAIITWIVSLFWSFPIQNH